MSDAFSDLWSSSAPSKPAAPKTLGGSTPTPSTNPTRKTQDVFSLLSSGNATKPSLKAPLGSNTSQSRSTPIAQTKPPITVNSINGNDAFGDLLGGSMASTSSSSRMTIAERAADAERQRLAALQKRQQVAKSEASAWAGLDSLGGPSFTPPTQTKSTLSDDDWGFGVDSQSIQPAIPTRPSNHEDDWDLGDLTTSASTHPVSSKPQPPNASKSRTLWDLDDLITSDSAAPEEDVLLHDQRDSLLGTNSNDDDDILGDLGKPIDSVSRTPSTDARKSSPLLPSATGNQPGGSRPVSPPPHIIGQLVEMGFSVQQARVALAATDTGLDVQVALETLLSNTAVSEPLPPTSRHQSPGPALPRGHRDRVQKSSVTSSAQHDNEEREVNLQEQADKLLAQASEIGLNVFNKASMFWREGKERAKKAYEERAAAGSLVGGAKKPPSNFSGRPKWMTDNPDEDADGDEWGPNPGSSKDAVDAAPGPPKAENTTRLDSQADITRPTPAQTKVAETDLLSNEPSFYVSPWRRGKPKPRVDDSTASSQSATPRPPSPIKAVPRTNVIPASESAISLSTHHKDLGAEKFKLGQYSEAEAAYSSAITALPDSHLLLVPLHNNRALTRLKIGDYAGVIEDTNAVVRIIGSGYHPARELKVPREEEGCSVDLADCLIKALKRRAEAFEGREKWDDARKDWQAIAGKEWARQNMRSEAVRGSGRCKGMTRPSSSSSAPHDNGVSKPRAATIPPRPRSVRPSIPARPSEALARLRSANDAADAEDQTRHELKDSVDAKILAWKTGKETNIRALLASLDTVLWPELGLQKVGMAELVSPSQVKIRYTKTIGKLHPDKINPSNSTIEQRMLANGVFGILNDAWNAFKQ